ncbi:MAG: glycerophosphodiester phosphodiesterase [Desulfovibrionaceae bacterium]|nr:glycerophosphodiester phosphodiesterase [Desulfovibrionaceae bacterium]
MSTFTYLAGVSLAALLLLPAAPQAAHYQANPEEAAPARPVVYRPAVAAHRGASGFLPEHTLEAKAMAYALGPDYIEQDVVMSKDDVLVILHDHTLETTTDVAQKFPGRHRRDGSYYAIDFTLAELKSLTVTERFDPKTGKAVFEGRFPLGTGIDFRIPTLREEFELIKGLNKSTGRNVGVYVEVKEPAFHEKEGKDIMGATIRMMDEYGFNSMQAKSILQIFDYEAVKNARAKGWKGELCMLVDMDGQMLKDDKARHKWLLTPEGIAEVSKYATIYAPWFSHMAVPNPDGRGYVINDVAANARRHGMKVHTWTHRTDKPLAGFKDSKAVLDCAFKELKVDGLFSDFCGQVVEYLKANRLR